MTAHNGDDDRDEEDPLLTPAEVARLFRVAPKTVTRWARLGRITAIRTLGGHRRFRKSDVRRALELDGRGAPAEPTATTPRPAPPAEGEIDLLDYYGYED